MGKRTRALDDPVADEAVSAPVVAPAPPAGNRATASRLTGAVPVRDDDVAGLGGLGGLAGNRATTGLLGLDNPSTVTRSAAPVVFGAPVTAPAAAGSKAPAQPAVVAVEEPPIDWIEQLPDEVKRQIDVINSASYGVTAAGRKRYEDQRTANRKTFMATMKGLFGSYDAVQSHFREVKPMTTDVNHVLYAHVSTRERLRAAQELLKAQDVPMPMTDVALGMRGDHLHPAGKGPGWFTHAAGFAVDWRAYHGPRITDPARITMFETITGGTPHFEFGMDPKKRLDLIVKMGQGRAPAADATAFLDRLEVEYKRLAAGSDKFKNDLPAANLKKLHDFVVPLEQARTALAAAQKRFDQLRSRRAAKEQLDAAQETVAAAQAAVDAAHTAGVAELPKIFEPWVKRLDDEIAEIDKVAADDDVDFLWLTGRFQFGELQKQIDELTVLRHRLEATAATELRTVLAVHQESLDVAARVTAAKQFLADPGTATLPPESATWAADLDEVQTRNDAVMASLVPLETTLHGVLPKAVVEPKPAKPVKVTPVRKQTVTALQAAVDKLPPRVDKAGEKVNPAAEHFAQATTDLTAAQKDQADRKAYNKGKVTALGGGEDRAAQSRGNAIVSALLEQKVKWLSLKEAKDGLLTDAKDFVFKSKDVSDPGIAQLVGQMPGTEGGGLFTPDPEGGEKKAKSGDWDSGHGFNLAFMKAMVSSGFELGVAWKGGSDTMHFELAEGRNMLTSFGAEPVVAGATLKAQEDKEAADKEAADKAAAEKAAADKAAAEKAAERNAATP